LLSPFHPSIKLSRVSLQARRRNATGIAHRLTGT
jgi:hypothetical protein